ncbi:hypothetical protein [Streptococcus ruminantium]|uniref:hypothetical protein n=1 Tax=Streptococcus ruminantium TaxID=1917441 RepID=UPI0012DBEB60|nr:hypothetical protein [Streptococcus ruminantium]
MIESTNITEATIQLWTLYITVAIALIGFVFNVISLWQTKKATEDMAKPYVNIFVDAYAIKSDYRVYVFKNFGNSPAYIDKIEVKGNLDKNHRERKFQSLVGNMLAPNQSITSVIQKDFHDTVTINIEYHDQHKKKYKDSFELDPDIFVSLLYAVPDTSNENDTASAIRQSTAALLRDMK